MEKGPERFTITAYWQRFQSELDALIDRFDPARSIDLWSNIQSMFPQEDEATLNTFMKTLRQAPQPDSSADRSATKLDDTFIRYYLIAMRMCEQGVRLESLPKFSFRGDSQNSIGQRIQDLQGLFGEKHLPEVFCAQSFAFVQAYHQHSHRFAQNQVYSSDSVANKFLGKYVERAKTSCAILERDMQVYDHRVAPDAVQGACAIASQPSDSAKMGEALTVTCPWLHEFYNHYAQFVRMFIHKHAPRTPVCSQEETKLDTQSAWWQWWQYLTWSAPSANPKSEPEREPASAEGKAKPDYLRLLETRYAQCVELSSDLSRLQNLHAMATDFEVIQADEATQAGMQALSEPVYLANELNRPLLILAEFYQNVIQALASHPELDAFTTVYFAMIESTYDKLDKTLNTEKPPLASDELTHLPGFCRHFELPHVYHAKWYQAFKGQFAKPEAITPILRAVSQHDNPTQADAKPKGTSSSKSRFLSAMMSKLKL